MRVESIQHQYHLLRLRIVLSQQARDEVRPVFADAPPAHFELPFAGQRLTGDERLARPFFLICIIFPLDLPRLCLFRRVLLSYESLVHLIHADERAGRIIRPTVDIQDSFHAPDKLGGRLGKAPRALQPRLKFIFLSIPSVLFCVKSGLTEQSPTLTGKPLLSSTQ